MNCESNSKLITGTSEVLGALPCHCGLSHGVPEKYLELVKIKQIGRVRAQILYKNGYKNKTSLKKARIYYNQIHTASLAFKEQILGKKK